MILDGSWVALGEFPRLEKLRYMSAQAYVLFVMFPL